MYYGNVTFTMSLPRSRTAWLAATFAGTQEPAVTMHDPLKKLASINELGLRVDAALRAFKAQPVPVIVADTAACLFYPQIAMRFPEARFCFIDRFPMAVERSLRRAGFAVEENGMREPYAYLRRALSAARGTGRFVHEANFDDLSNLHEQLRLWQFFGFRAEFPDLHFKVMNKQIIHVPFAEQMRQVHAGKVERLMATRHEGW